MGLIDVFWRFVLNGVLKIWLISSHDFYFGFNQAFDLFNLLYFMNVTIVISRTLIFEDLIVSFFKENCNDQLDFKFKFFLNVLLCFNINFEVFDYNIY